MNNHRELSVDELGNVSGGNFNIGRPFFASDTIATRV